MEHLEKIEDAEDKAFQLIREARKKFPDGIVDLDEAWKVIRATGVLWSDTRLIDKDFLIQNPELVYEGVKLFNGVGIDRLPDVFRNSPTVFYNVFEHQQPHPWGQSSIAWFGRYIGRDLQESIDRIALKNKQWDDEKNTVPTPEEMKTYLLELISQTKS